MRFKVDREPARELGRMPRRPSTFRGDMQLHASRGDGARTESLVPPVTWVPGVAEYWVSVPSEIRRSQGRRVLAGRPSRLPHSCEKTRARNRRTLAGHPNDGTGIDTRTMTAGDGYGRCCPPPCRAQA